MTMQERIPQDKCATQQMKTWLARARVAQTRVHVLQQARYQMQQAYTAARNSAQLAISQEKYAAYVALETEIDCQQTALLRMRCEILQAIDAIQDDTLATLLTAYYVNGKTWEAVAEQMGYALRHLMRLHEKALCCAVIARQNTAK